MTPLLRYLLLIPIIIHNVNSAEFLQSGVVQDLRTFYDIYDETSLKINLTIEISRTLTTHACCITARITYCSSNNINITMYKNLDKIDIKCPDIEEIKYKIYYYLPDPRPPLSIPPISYDEPLSNTSVIWMTIVAVVSILVGFVMICLPCDEYCKDQPLRPVQFINPDLPIDGDQSEELKEQNHPE